MYPEPEHVSRQYSDASNQHGKVVSTYPKT